MLSAMLDFWTAMFSTYCRICRLCVLCPIKIHFQNGGFLGKGFRDIICFHDCRNARRCSEIRHLTYFFAKIGPRPWLTQTGGGVTLDVSYRKRPFGRFLMKFFCVSACGLKSDSQRLRSSTYFNFKVTKVQPCFRCRVSVYRGIIVLHLSVPHLSLCKKKQQPGLFANMGLVWRFPLFLFRRWSKCVWKYLPWLTPTSAPACTTFYLKKYQFIVHLCTDARLW